MINRFQSHSRFAALADDIDEPVPIRKSKPIISPLNNRQQENSVKENTFLRTSSSYQDHYRHSYVDYNSKEYKERREREDLMRRENQRIKMEEEKKKNLAVECFPSLGNTTNGNSNTNIVSLPSTITFLEKASKVLEMKKNLKQKAKEEVHIKENSDDDVDVDDDDSCDTSNDSELDDDNNRVKSGWVEIQKNPHGGASSFIYTYGKNTYPIEWSGDQFRKYKDPAAAKITLGSLVYLHRFRTESYKRTWGYEEWERTFQFPEYDYQYFDSLDEQIED